MQEFSMTIAGRTALVRPLFESTEHYCGRYPAEGTPDFEICVTPQDLAFEQEELDREAAEEGFRFRKFTEPFLERTAIARAFAEDLFDRGTLMLHGSAVALDGKGYLFTARSGTGKSTHTRLWCQAFGDRAVMINDDKPFVQCAGAEIMICGSPWSGKHGLDNNISVPLAGICLLERGKENKIRPISPAEAMPMLLKQGYCPLAEEKQPRYRQLVAELAERTALWHMTCTKAPEAALVAQKAMSESD